jgi:hypothetical protein
MSDDAVGVDPGRLNELTSALEHLRDVLAENVPTIVGKLNQYWSAGQGIVVSLDSLQQAQARSVDDASDMRARFNSAIAWEDSAPVSLRDHAGSGSPSAFKIEETAGARAGEQFEDGKITKARFFALLRAHDDDAGWQTGAMRILGSPGLARLENHVPGTGQMHDQNMRALAMSVAAAMASGVTFPNTPAENPVFQPDDLSLIAKLLKYADFSPQVLASLGAEALIPVGQSPAEANDVWSALDANPQAAGLFIEQNALEIVTDISATVLATPIEDVNPLVAVLKAGTLGLKGADPTRAKNAVSALVQAYYNDQNAYAPPQFGALYGEIIKAYWPDVNYAVTNPSTLGGISPDGFHLTDEQWAPFVDEAMRNPNAAALVLACAHAQGYQYFQMQGQQPVIPNDPFKYARDAGKIDGYFDYQALRTYNQLNSENRNSWKATLTNDLALAAIWASPGPEVSIPASLGADVVLPMIDNVLDAHNSVSPPAPSLNEMQQEIAIAYYNEAISGGTASNPTLQAVVRAANTANAQAQSVQEAAAQQGEKPDQAPFLEPDGKIFPLNSMSPAQQAAFIDWLNATADQVEPVLEAAQSGYLSAASPEAQPGG